MYNPIMQNPNSDNSEWLASPLQQHCKVAGKLLQLMHALKQAIDAEELDTVEAILAQKQRLTDELIVLDSMQKAHPQHESSQEFAPEHLEQRINEFNSLIRAVQQMERESIELLQLRHQETAAQLHALLQTRNASRSYAQANQTAGKSRISISG